MLFFLDLCSSFFVRASEISSFTFSHEIEVFYTSRGFNPFNKSKKIAGVFAVQINLYQKSKLPPPHDVRRSDGSNRGAIKSL